MYVHEAHDYYLPLALSKGRFLGLSLEKAH